MSYSKTFQKMLSYGGTENVRKHDEEVRAAIEKVQNNARAAAVKLQAEDKAKSDLLWNAFSQWRDRVEKSSPKTVSLSNRYGIDTASFDVSDLDKWSASHNYEYRMNGNGGYYTPKYEGGFFGIGGRKLSTEQEDKDFKTLEQLAQNNERRKMSKEDGGAAFSAIMNMADSATFGIASGMAEHNAKKAYEAAGLPKDDYVGSKDMLQKTYKSHPIASTAGNIAGGLISFAAAGNLVSSGLSAIPKFAKLAPAVQNAINMAATSGAVSAVESAASKEWNKDNWYKQAGSVVGDTVVSSLGAYLGGRLSSAAAGKVLTGLQKSGLSAKAAKALAGSAGALTFAGTATGANEAKNALTAYARGEEYKPDIAGITANMVVLAVYSGLKTYIGEAVNNPQEKFEYFKKSDFKNPDTLKSKYHSLMMEHHPDKGGNPEIAAKITAEYKRAQKKLAGNVMREMENAQNPAAGGRAGSTEQAVRNGIAVLNEAADTGGVVYAPVPQGMGGSRIGNSANTVLRQEQNTQNLSDFGAVQADKPAVQNGPFVKSVERTGSEQNLQRFADNVDKVFKGELPERAVVTIGQTPKLLQQYGANDLPLTINQSTMYKIAYPQGYFGAEDQGHNLGIPALKQLPAQIAEPAAILKSNTQGGSLVLLTEWNDTNNNPVIIPIHLDRQGNISMENRVASAYGKQNLDTLLTDENGDNTILYTKENKSIDEFRGSGLQLPGTPEDDTLVSMNSIPQSGGEVKGNADNMQSTLNETYQERVLSEKNAVPRQDNSNISYLTDSDIDEYMSTGNQHTQHKKNDIVSNGDKAILTSKQETDAFIDRSLSDADFHQIKAFSKVSDRMAADVLDVGGVNLNNYYLELNSSDILHTADHMEETRKNQIPLIIEDIKRLPEYIVNYDEVLEVKRHKDGRTSVLLGKKINGHSVIVTIASNGRKSLALKSAYVLDTQKYNELYGAHKKDTAKREAHAAYNAALPHTSETVPTTVSSDNRIPQKPGNVKSANSDIKSEFTRNSVSSDNADRWTATNRNDGKHFRGSIGDIIKYAERKLGIPISKGKLQTPNANGIYKTRSEAIRTRVINNLPTVSHEIGHHFDKLYGLQSSAYIQQAIDNMDADFSSQYRQDEIAGEAVAEFMRTYLRDRESARTAMPDFTADFEQRLSKQDLKNIQKIGDMVNSYMLSDTDVRMDKAIKSRADRMSASEIGQKLRDMPTDAYIGEVDDLYALKLLDEAAKENGTNNIVGKSSSYTMAMNSRDSNARVQHIITGDLTDFDGNKIDVSLKEVLSGLKNKKEYRAFNRYLVARHAVEWLEANIGGDVKRVFGDDVINDPDVMRGNAAELERKYPEFKQVAERLYQWQNKLMKAWLVDTGLLTQEQYDNMLRRYPNYVPFYRKTDKKTFIGKRGFASQNSGIRKAHGSGLEMYDPIENIVINVDKYVKAASKNAAAKAAAHICDTTEGLGSFMEEVPPDKVPNSINITQQKERLAKRLSENGVEDALDIIDEAMGDVITQWNVPRNQSSDIISVMDGGERKYYQVHDKRLLNALTAMNNQELGKVLAVTQSVVRAFSSMTTGSNPLFMAGNAIRDLQTARVNTIAKNPAQFWGNFGKAVIEQLKKSEDYQKYVAMGGKYSSNISQSTNIMRKTMREVKQINPNMGIKLANVLIHPVESINMLSDIVETTPRFAEFKTALQQGRDVHEAHLAAKDVTVNFQKHGASDISKTLRAAVPFYNAGVQGLDKMGRQAVNHPMKTALRIGLSIILPSLITMALNGRDDESKKAYNRLSSYTKNNFFCIYIGNDEFITLPKARELAIPASAVERAVEKFIFDNDEAVYGLGDYILSMLPGFGAEDIIGFGTLYSLGKNEDFKGSPIVPESMKDLEPRLQYDENTTWIAKKIGNIFNLSPKQIDYVISSNTGGIGQINKALGTQNRDWSFGLGNKFVRSSLYSTDVLNRVYDKAQKAKVAAKSYPDDMGKAYTSKRYSNATTVLSNMSKLAKEADTENEAKTIRKMQLSYAEKVWSSEENETDKKIKALAQSTGDTEIFYTAPQNSVTYDKQKYMMSAQTYIKYAEECEKAYYDACSPILDGGGDDASKIESLKKAKDKARKKVKTDMKDEIKQSGRVVFERNQLKKGE